MPEADLTIYMSLDTAKGFCYDCNKYNQSARCEENRRIDEKPATDVPKMKAFYELRDAARFTALAAAKRELNVLNFQETMNETSSNGPAVQGYGERRTGITAMKGYLKSAMAACALCGHAKAEMAMVINEGEDAVNSE